ncbi:hypothetical protein RBB79_08890 [Tunturiibacter empetritectus]|uniref:Uncharacterized protein n=1 Tax=Tunturiibacter lichenicola TaxID=2051959 RepID=A0A852VDS6_9BACT|nr:hypothetical protein [Edaphobacter lichenicola]NYF89657.1 hypothetical protein [Edaphobacter lichenicola]
MSLVRFNRAALCVLLSGLVFTVAGMAQLMPAPPQAPQIPQGPPMPSMPTMPSDSQNPQGPPPDASQQRQQQQDQERRNNQQWPGGFLGAWCAQGDPSKQASISASGPMLNLTNESGSTSIGNLQGDNQIVAPEWQFVTGTLSGGRIDWSNGTFWTRCYNGGGGGGRRAPNLNGRWYPNGNRSLSCSIQQRRGNLTLQNENGDRATGSFNGKWSVTTNWQGTSIAGTISRDGNRIDWSNGTYWIRYRLYGQ